MSVGKCRFDSLCSCNYAWLPANIGRHRPFAEYLVCTGFLKSVTCDLRLVPALSEIGGDIVLVRSFANQGVAIRSLKPENR